MGTQGVKILHGRPMCRSSMIPLFCWEWQTRANESERGPSLHWGPSGSTGSDNHDSAWRVMVQLLDTTRWMFQEQFLLIVSKDPKQEVHRSGL